MALYFTRWRDNFVRGMIMAGVAGTTLIIGSVLSILSSPLNMTILLFPGIALLVTAAVCLIPFFIFLGVALYQRKKYLGYKTGIIDELNAVREAEFDAVNISFKLNNRRKR